ncbi:MAG TPA: CPBP family intramembrane metalloprotease domain-containing protein [Cyanobacteria bacterium UBA8803]|nr:CPBP family intramembrane metalloprotease domain-containing protein [Cyanobacteria bacterium UBA9273]HBL57664.1 CPBP family intramembrane metalloprotease domain-containing protein [Cyanobacteria bacterium UBA8803]
MRIDRLLKLMILTVLTFLAVFQVSFSLVESWSQPQIQSRLELYQTSLLLNGAEWQGPNTDLTQDFKAARNPLIGSEPFKNAQKQYQEALAATQSTQSKILAKLQELSSKETAISQQLAKPQLQLAPIEDAPSSSQLRQQLQKSLSQTAQLIDELNLRLGILQAKQGETESAIKTWSDVINGKAVDPAIEATTPSTQTAVVLIGLWSDPPRLLPDAESELQKTLDSWFRNQALRKLYQLQQRQDALSLLQAQQQQMAEQAIWKLALVGGIPGLGGLLGVGLLLFLFGQWVVQGRRSLLATNSNIPWQTPWDGETIWQVLILGFFFIGQILLPLLLPIGLRSLGLNPVNFTIRMKAFYTLLTYLMLAGGGLLVIYLSIKPFLPLSEDWFSFKWRSNWFTWGLGGYLVALPLVILVSLINQKLWQGQGGSNPILPLVLEGQDKIALGIFALTACIAAPLFEEMMFRGFLLPSLTRYLPVWGAVGASSLLFAIAHLSLSEVLPLTTLGIVLGVVYTRSRNLLAPMLLHSLWNSGTLLSLFVLGSGFN